MAGGMYHSNLYIYLHSGDMGYINVFFIYEEMIYESPWFSWTKAFYWVSVIYEK